MENLTKPTMPIPFDYKLLILVVEHAYMVCPITFIVKILKQMETSFNRPWGKAMGSRKTSKSI